MWTRSEIQEITKTLQYASLEEFLTTEEIMAIPTAWLPNLKSRILEPKHSRPVIYVQIQIIFSLILIFRIKQSIG